MTTVRLLILLIPILVVAGCTTETSTEPSPPSGPAIGRITVTAHCSDEYYRSIGFSSGSISVSLSGTGITGNAILTPDSPVAVFDNLPLQQYQVTESRESCYTVTNSFRLDTLIKQWEMGGYLSRIPPPAFRVDSILCLVNSITPRVMVRITYGTTLPSGGHRQPVLFADTSADVSPRYGAYAYAEALYDTSAKSAQFGDFYQALQWAGFAPGRRVYLTFRLSTGATRSQQDPRSGLWVYTGLETNTTATTSFIMP